MHNLLLWNHFDLIIFLGRCHDILVGFHGPGAHDHAAQGLERLIQVGGEINLIVYAWHRIP